jgi:hypothetical protein
MLTGLPPFKGEYDQGIIYSIMNEEPEKNRKFRNILIRPCLILNCL